MYVCMYVLTIVWGKAKILPASMSVEEVRNITRSKKDPRAAASAQV